MSELKGDEAQGKEVVDQHTSRAATIDTVSHTAIAEAEAHCILFSPVRQAGRLYLLPPYLCFLSLDRRSARFTIPLFCIRRVERLNSRAGVFALGVGLWHGLRVVRIQLLSDHPCECEQAAVSRKMDDRADILPSLPSSPFFGSPFFLRADPPTHKSPPYRRTLLHPPQGRPQVSGWSLASLDLRFPPSRADLLHRSSASPASSNETPQTLHRHPLLGIPPHRRRGRICRRCRRRRREGSRRRGQGHLPARTG